MTDMKDIVLYTIIKWSYENPNLIEMKLLSVYV